MTYVKIVWLLVVAVVALLAISASASATRLTETTSGESSDILVVPAFFEANSNLGSEVNLTGPLGLNVACAGSTVRGSLTNAGGSSETVRIAVGELFFSNCTNGYVVEVNFPGSLEIHTESGSANDNGTITSNGATITVTNTPVGTCNYRTENTDIGRLTGTTSVFQASIDISASIPRHAGSVFCGSSGVWEGNYTINVPWGLSVH